MLFFYNVQFFSFLDGKEVSNRGTAEQLMNMFDELNKML